MSKITKFSEFLNEAKSSGDETAKDACVNVGKTLKNAKAMIDGEIEELDRIKKKWKKDTKGIKSDLSNLSKELGKVISSLGPISKDDAITYVK